jgi:hypothetical protein
MAYSSLYSPDDDTEEELVVLGEVLSEQDGQLACVTLFELGIPCDIAYVESDAGEIRRFLEGWSANQMVLVRPQDVDRAFAAVSARLAPPQPLKDMNQYLEQCSPDDLFKILDLPDIWTEPVLKATKSVLAARGLAYPPDGVSSRLLPAICLIFGVLCGPIVAMMRWRIDKVRTTKDGGKRPYYDDQTRQRSDRCMVIGLVIWLLALLFIFLGMKLIR